MDAVLPTGTAPNRHRQHRDHLSRPTIAYAAFVALLTATLLAVVPRPLSPDVAGQLWIAERLRHGARLYVDIREINPPLWFWLAMPVDALASLTATRPADVLIAALGVVTVASLLATDRLLARLATTHRVAVLLYGAVVLLVMPLRDLGQREQLALISALPYAALIAARREECRIPWWLATAIGVGAAVGFAFKHYFAAVPLLLEVWLLLGLDRSWRPWRPELLGLGGAALAYAVAVLTVTPAFLAESLPEAALAYGGGAPPEWRYLLRPAQSVWLLLGCALWMTRGTGRLPPVATALLIASAGFGLAWGMQHKGWPYHSIPTTGLLAMAVATTLAERRWRPGPLVLTALAAPLALAAIPTQVVPDGDTDIAAALADLHPGDTVAIVSTEGVTFWPATIDRGFRYPGRRTSFWMLPIIDALPDDSRIAAFGRRVVRETLADYRCLPPRRLVFAPGGTGGGTGAAGDPLRFFRRDPDFARLLTHYRRLERPGGFDAFELARALPPVTRWACPRV